MPSIAKQLKPALETLTAVQEYPFSAFESISRAKVDKDTSMHAMDETRLILRRRATDPQTGDGFVAIEILGTPDHANWMVLQFKIKDHLPVNVILSRHGWTIRNSEFEVGQNEEGHVWNRLDSKKVDEFNSSLHLKVGNAIRSVAERMLKRFSRVDSL